MTCSSKTGMWCSLPVFARSRNTTAGSPWRPGKVMSAHLRPSASPILRRPLKVSKVATAALGCPATPITTARAEVMASDKGNAEIGGQRLFQRPNILRDNFKGGAGSITAAASDQEFGGSDGGARLTPGASGRAVSQARKTPGVGARPRRARAERSAQGGRMGKRPKPGYS